MNIFLPSVEPTPMEAKDFTEDASEKSLPDMLSLKTYDPVLVRWESWGASSMLGLENAKLDSP